MAQILKIVVGAIIIILIILIIIGYNGDWIMKVINGG